MNPERVNAIFTILLAALIAISIKMIGVLLITGLLIIPTAMLNLSNNPKQMVVLSIIGGLLSVFIGLYASFEINTASGPSIVVVALILFILSLLESVKRIMKNKKNELTKNQKIVLDFIQKSNKPVKDILFCRMLVKKD